MKRLLVFVFVVLLLGSCGKKGCTDPVADNYDHTAKRDDGTCGYPDTTYIPDPNFELTLINLGYDSEYNGWILTDLIKNITILDVNQKYINSLQGIEDFTALRELSCWSNEITSLDLSNNTALTYLDCNHNQLTSLDVSNNTALTYLSCFTNQLTSLDVSNNTSLNELLSSTNQLTSLDVSNNTALTRLNCENNQLTSLDVSNNTALTKMVCNYNQLTCLNLKNGNNTNFNFIMANYNPNLSCIEVDDPGWSYQNWPSNNFYFDNGVTFSTNCNYPAGCF